MAKKFMTDLTSYEKTFLREGRPTLGLLFYRDEWIWDDLHYQKAFIEEAERQGLNVIAVFTNGLPDPKLGMPTIHEVFEKYFMKEGKPLVDAIVNVMKFSFTTSGSISIKALEEMAVPVLEAYSLIAPKEEWEASPEGMNAMEISISVTMPEFDGIIHGMPIAAKHVKEDGEVEYLPIPERMRAMVSRAGAWARLHRKPNAEKKIAIIFHNYPPKNSNIGSAYGLDSIESVRRLLGFMKEAGYQVDFIPEDTEAFMKRLTAQATNDRSMLTEEQEAACQKVPKKLYCDFFAAFPEETRRQMEKDWGKVPGRVMTTESGDILVPGLMDGHIFLTVQAPRGYGFDASKIYHDPFIAPTHQYLAYYQWIRDVWGADAVVHVGTHGNLEWLPGKSAGMDRGSYPDLALGSLPNIYPYHMTITGEGIQAKRRGGACLVDHLPAPMEEAGTYEELAELEQAMDEYAHFEKSEPETAKRLVPWIRELAEKASLDGEVPYTEADLAGYLSRLHCYIEDLKIASAMSDCTFWERCRRGKRSSMKYWLFFVCRMVTSPRSVSCWLRRRGHPWIRCWDRHRHCIRMVSPGASGWRACRRRQRGWSASWQNCISTKRRRRHWGQRESSRCFVSFVRRYIRALQRQKRKWSIPFAGFLPVTLCRGSLVLRTRAVSLFCRQG